MSAPWHRYSAHTQTLMLTLHIQPNARESRVIGAHGDALKVRIAGPAVDNHANTLLVRFLAAQFGLPAARVAIRRGATSRRKLIEIAAPGAAAAALLESWEAL